ncbi:hypothetical protein B0H16DRAFT_1465029 [Mycena metata]|uniref:Uncharacterized protein n=1 Tax=Mycena metata TaxID=1033252 RepID=A0AAD7ICQ4_9AGAR|nr:hypothetical protein B0H16DRAFT_1465029 [Mycena metata]
MSHFHIMVTLMFLLVAGVATGSAELNRTRSLSTLRAPLASGRCKPISLAELQIILALLCGTFYERLSVVVLGKRRGDRYLDSVGFKVKAAFQDGSKDARVCIEGVDVQNTGGHAYTTSVSECSFSPGEPICYETKTYMTQVAPASGEMTFDYPAGLSTVQGLKAQGYSTCCAGVGSPLTEGGIYETSFSAQDVTLPEVDSGAKTVNGLCSDTLGSSIATQRAFKKLLARLLSAFMVNGHYYWYLWLDDWTTWEYSWSYSQSQATITTTGNDHSLGDLECICRLRFDTVHRRAAETVHQRIETRENNFHEDSDSHQPSFTGLNNREASEHY